MCLALLTAENMVADDAVFIFLYIIMTTICVFSVFQALNYLLNMHYIIWSSYQPWAIGTSIIFVERNLSFRELAQTLSLFISCCFFLLFSWNLCSCCWGKRTQIKQGSLERQETNVLGRIYRFLNRGWCSGCHSWEGDCCEDGDPGEGDGLTVVWMNTVERGLQGREAAWGEVRMQQRVWTPWGKSLTGVRVSVTHQWEI